eukprot:2246741-Pyramimonas_sp.AAC.1
MALSFREEPIQRSSPAAASWHLPRGAGSWLEGGVDPAPEARDGPVGRRGMRSALPGAGDRGTAVD